MLSNTSTALTSAACRGALMLLCAAAFGCTTIAPPRGGDGTSTPRTEPAGESEPGVARAPRPPGEETVRRPLPPREPAEPIEEPDASGSADAGAPAMPAASLALLEQSRDEREAGSLSAAASSIERALRIDPNNALLWLELAEIKLADDDPAQAGSMAQKALTLAGGDVRLERRAERLIALARQ